MKYITDDFVNVYEAADTGSKKVLQIAYGDAVEVIDTQGDWAKFKLLSRLDRDTSGWARLDPNQHLQDGGILKFYMEVIRYESCSC